MKDDILTALLAANRAFLALRDVARQAGDDELAEYALAAGCEIARRIGRRMVRRPEAVTS
jgi:hypothetical protein